MIAAITASSHIRDFLQLHFGFKQLLDSGYTVSAQHTETHNQNIHGTLNVFRMAIVFSPCPRISLFL